MSNFDFPIYPGMVVRNRAIGDPLRYVQKLNRDGDRALLYGMDGTIAGWADVEDLVVVRMDTPPGLLESWKEN